MSKRKLRGLEVEDVRKTIAKLLFNNILINFDISKETFQSK